MICYTFSFKEEVIFFWEKTMNEKLKKEDYIKILKEKYNEQGRLPKKSDFENCDVVKIKSYFVTWPRALEEAGLIPEKEKGKRKKDV